MQSLGKKQFIYNKTLPSISPDKLALQWKKYDWLKTLARAMQLIESK